ncbi:MAG TPA: hypothetical protein VF017_17450 [Thermoanaerobaculia bacterium]|nr:hypothetical protein [Thermoanaerobaculia bacterium]
MRQTPRSFRLAALAALAVSFVLPFTAQAADPNLWLHVKVHEQTGERARITVNLPLTLVETAAALITDEAQAAGRIRLDHADLDAADLRALIDSLKGSPDMKFITVESDRENVQIAKDRGYLIARVHEQGERPGKVTARIPMPVVEALLSGTGDQFDVRAALVALAAHGEGEIVTVDEQDSTVRVWIDAHPETR